MEVEHNLLSNKNRLCSESRPLQKSIRIQSQLYTLKHQQPIVAGRNAINFVYDVDLLETVHGISDCIKWRTFTCDT